MLDKCYIKFYIEGRLFEGENIEYIEKELIKMVKESIKEKIKEAEEERIKRFGHK